MQFRTSIFFYGGPFFHNNQRISIMKYLKGIWLLTVTRSSKRSISETHRLFYFQIGFQYRVSQTEEVTKEENCKKLMVI